MTTTIQPIRDCESCGLEAEATITYPDTTFTLCLRCVPAELRPRAEAIPGLEDLVDDIVQLLNEIHPDQSDATTVSSL